MADLYNVKTRQKEAIDDPEALKQAISAGTHSYESNADVTGFDPSGEKVFIPAQNVKAAIDQGYSVQTPTQKAVDDYVSENDNLKGSLKVGLGQFADEALLGIPELIYDKTQDPLEVAKKEALKKSHDLANSLGGITGFGASFITGAPIFKAGTKASEITAKAIAEKLAATAGAEVGKRTISKAAKEIAGRLAGTVAGSSVEGAIQMAPYAATEALLGNPDDAAETLLSGVGVGALFGAGGELASGLLGITKKALKAGGDLVGEAQPTVENAFRKGANVLTGVPEDQLKHYVENIDRVNQAPSSEFLTDLINDNAGKYRTDVEIAKEVVRNSKQEFDDAYRSAKFDLSSAKAPSSVADNIMASLESTKSELGTLSAQADDQLAASGATFRKSDLLDFVDKIGSSVGAGEKKALIGDEAVAAVAKLKTMRDRIEGGLGETIDAPTLRDVLRQVRADINYNQMSGEFNDTVNKMKKEFTSKISTVLKGGSEEYASTMARMAELSESLSGMTKHFGDKQKALSSLDAIASGKKIVKDEVLSAYEAATGADLRSQFGQVTKAKGDLERIKRGEDLSGELIPELKAKLERDMQAVEAADKIYDPLRHLDGKGEDIIRRLGFKNPKLKDQRAIEELERLTGEPIATLIKDRNVLDAFNKQYTQGSRKAVMGAAAGAAIGGPVGAAVGGLLGGIGDIYGPQILKRMVDKTPNVSGLLFVEKAMKRSAEKLDQIPKILDRMSDGKRLKPRSVGIRAVERLLDNKADPKNKPESTSKRVKYLEKLNEDTGKLTGNPGLLAETMSRFTAPISENGAPQIGQALSGKMTAALSYLSSQLPRPPAPQSPFAPKMKWQPPDYEVAAFEQKAQVVEDPWSVLTELEGNTLTQNHMEALKAVYPGIYTMIRNKVQEAVVSGVKPLPYAERIKLSLLMDAPMDSTLSPNSIMYYQETFLQPADEAPGPVGPGAAPGYEANVKVSGSTQTPNQRITNT